MAKAILASRFDMITRKNEGKADFWQIILGDKAIIDNQIVGF